MMGLLYKDCIIMRRQLWTLLVFLVIYGGLAAIGVFDVSLMAALIAVLGVNIPTSSVAMDDASRWNCYAVATPAGRRGIVNSKYLFTVLLLLLSALVAIVLLLLLSLCKLSDASSGEIVFIVLGCAAVTLLLDAVLLPLLLKYGAEKARFINLITFFVVFGSILLLSGLMQSGITLPKLPHNLVQALPGLFGILAIGAFVVSYFISLGIYDRKEF